VLKVDIKQATLSGSERRWGLGMHN